MTATYCQWCGNQLALDTPSPRACTSRHETMIREAEDALALEAADAGRLHYDNDRIIRVAEHGQTMDLADAVGRLVADGRLTPGLAVTDTGRTWLAEVPA